MAPGNVLVLNCNINEIKLEMNLIPRANNCYINPVIPANNYDNAKRVRGCSIGIIDDYCILQGYKES